MFFFYDFPMFFDALTALLNSTFFFFSVYHSVIPYSSAVCSGEGAIRFYMLYCTYSILLYWVILYLWILALTFFNSPRWLITGFRSFFRKSSSYLQIFYTRRWQEASSLLRTHSSGVTYEPHCYLVLGRSTSVITLKILVTSVQNLIGWLTR
jgi:hypothetical protein